MIISFATINKFYKFQKSFQLQNLDRSRLFHIVPDCFQVSLRGKGGVPWVQIMENELEYLADRGGHGGHLGEQFVKKYCS